MLSIYSFKYSLAMNESCKHIYYEMVAKMHNDCYLTTEFLLHKSFLYFQIITAYLFSNETFMYS